MSAYLITMITGHPLLLSSHQFLFWFILAGVAVPYRLSADERRTGARSRYLKFAFGALAVILFVGYGRWFYETDPGFKVKEYGFYDYESVDGVNTRWAWRDAATVVEAAGRFMEIRAEASPRNSSGPDGLELKLFINDQLMDVAHFFDGGVKYFHYYIPAGDGEKIRIRTRANRTYNPYEAGESEEITRSREQAVLLGEARFLKIAPKHGVGFYDPETGTGATGARPGAPRRFRWTGMRASMPLDYPVGRKTEWMGLLEFSMRCVHPDIEKKPVVVRMLADEKVVREKKFRDHEWKTVYLSSDDLKGAKVLTFHASRTWNPREMGVSGDERDIGAAVAFNN